MQLLATTLILTAPLFQLAHGVSDRFICGDVSNKPSTPKYLRCKFEGSVVNEKAVKTFGASYNSCRNQCLVSNVCKAFSFQPTDPNADPEGPGSGTCKTYHARIVKQTSRKGSTGVYYWNRNCFEANLVKYKPVVNGDFQTGSLQPWVYDDPPVVLVVESGPDTPPNYSAKLPVKCPPQTCTDGSISYSKAISQIFKLCEGVTYSLSFDVLQPTGETTFDPNSYFQIYIGKPDNGIIPIGNGRPDGANSVQYQNEGAAGNSYPAGTPFHVVSSFNAPASGGYIFVFAVQVYGSSSIFSLQMDNVVIKAIG